MSEDGIRCIFNEKTKQLEMVKAIYMTEADQKKLFTGMEKLKKKYPKISKECFG